MSSGVADDQPADDEHAVAVEVRRSPRSSRCRRCRPFSRRLFFAARLEEREVLVEDVLDAEEHVAESGAPHQRRQRRAVLRRSATSSPARCSRCRRSPASTIALAERLEPRDVERDVVVDEEDRARAARARVGDVGEHALESDTAWKLRPRISMIEQKLQS